MPWVDTIGQLVGNVQSRSSITNLRTELDVVHYFQGQRVVAKEHMNTKEANQTKITQSFIERTRSEFANKLADAQSSELGNFDKQIIISPDLFFRLALTCCHEVLIDFGLLYQ